MSTYQGFLKEKQFRTVQSGFNSDASGFSLFDYQSDIVKWALARGKAAVFADTGLGKTAMQLVWARKVAEHTTGNVLILAPLAVNQQTISEGKRIGIDVVRFGETGNIQIANYEQLHNIDVARYSGIVLDESSLLKGDGPMRRNIIELFAATPYRLSCTATPSPNDSMELGTQSEFLGIMSQVEMLSMFFIHDGGDTSKWRLKGHGIRKFYEWLATWSVFISKPSDLGYQDDGHELPSLHIHQHVLDSGITDGLFAKVATDLGERNEARRDTINIRVEKCREIADQLEGQCLIWCTLNDESEQLTKAIAGAWEVKGSDKPDYKIRAMLGFSGGVVERLVTKVDIAGYGMNWQNCNQMIFCGLKDSWEDFYQAVRRCWRYGQSKPVHVHLVMADVQAATLATILKKEQQNKVLKAEMLAIMRSKTLEQMGKASTEKTEYNAGEHMRLPKWI